MKEGLVVWIGAIVIHNEGHVNLVIWVYSGYPYTCKDHKMGQRQPYQNAARQQRCNAANFLRGSEDDKIGMSERERYGDAI